MSNRITQADIRLVQEYRDTVLQRAEDRGLTVHFSNDAAAFVDFLRRQPGRHGVSATHDPARSYITPEKFLWLRLDDGNLGVYCHAIRVVDTNDLIQDVITHRIFDNLTLDLTFRDVELYPEAWDIELSGQIVIGGGLWVHPDYRGREYSALFRKLLRVLAIPTFLLDYYASFILNTADRKAWVTGSHGSPNAIPLLHGYYPPYKDTLDVQLAYSSRRQILDNIRKELGHSAPTSRGSRRQEIHSEAER